MLNTALSFNRQGQSAKLRNRNLRILDRICMNTAPLPVYIGRHHSYNKQMVSMGTHLNCYYILDSFLPSFLFLLIAGGTLYFVDT
jgi:hypothetical protein